MRLRSLEFMTKFDVNYTMALDGTVTPEPEIIPVDLSGYVP